MPSSNPSGYLNAEPRLASASRKSTGTGKIFPTPLYPGPSGGAGAEGMKEQVN